MHIVRRPAFAAEPWWLREGMMRAKDLHQVGSPEVHSALAQVALDREDHAGRSGF